MVFDDIRCLIGKTGTAKNSTGPYQKGTFLFEGGCWDYQCGTKVLKGEELLVKNVDSEKYILFVIKKQ